MKEIVCRDCWRRENLTFAQRLDPSYVATGPAGLCTEHRARRDELLRGHRRAPRQDHQAKQTDPAP